MSGSAGSSPVLLATRNPGKLRELRSLFAELGCDLVDLATLGLDESGAEDELECFATFEENAMAKARYFHVLAGLPTVADDSGLAVDALDGAPGVWSKRYAGIQGSGAVVDAANNAKLIGALADHADRRARFVCAAAYVDDSTALVVRGQAEGRITYEPLGAHGFGYDPYFESAELGMTFAEADIAAKQRVSHRARAFRALVRELAWGAVGQRAAADSVDGPDRLG